MSMPLLLYRFLRYGYTYRRIPLTQGKYAIVDPDEYHHLSKHKWHTVRKGDIFYAVRTAVTIAGRKRIHMHRCILKVPDGIFVDHINQDGLNNRKANLRPANPAQNMCNRSKYKNGSFSSKYKGVTRIRGKKPWQAHITVNRRTISLGSFRDEIDAAKAYDRAAKKYHGQFAALNFAQPKRLPLHCITNLFRSLHNYLASLSSMSRVQFGRVSTAHRKPVGMMPLSGEFLTSFQSGVEKS